MTISPLYLIIGALAFIILILTILLIFTLTTHPRSEITEIAQKLGSLENSALQMQKVAHEVSNLNLLLHATKLRGNFGEYLLYKLLKDTLPPKNYETQFQFSDGATVDAIIKLGRHIIPIDSKFPLESFERYLSANEQDSKRKAKAEFIRSVKARIDEIAKKYIRPQENTFDFALMYIPSESVYHEILTNDNTKGYELFDYAMNARVITVSPNTFYAYLLSVVYGLRGLQIEEKAEIIVRKISGIQREFAALTEELATLGKHLTNAGAKFSEAHEKSEKISRSLEKLTE